MYHKITRNDKEMMFNRHCTTLDRFKKQLNYLIQRKYRFLSLEEFRQLMNKREDDSSPKVLLTFDDGSIDSYLYAYPVLRGLNIPALFFLVTGYTGTSKVFWWDRIRHYLSKTEKGGIEINIQDRKINMPLGTIRQKRAVYSLLSDRFISQRYSDPALIDGVLSSMDCEEREMKRSALNWQEVREMINGGMSFGAHTENHIDLSRADYEIGKSEILNSIRKIEGMTGTKNISFAYPYGLLSNKYIECLKSSGVEFAFTTRVGCVNINGDRYKIRRNAIEEDNYFMFRYKISRIYPFLSNNYNRLRAVTNLIARLFKY